MVNTNIEEPTSSAEPGISAPPTEPTVEEPTEPTQGEPVTPEEPAESTEEPGAEPAAEPVKKGKTAQQRIQELVAEREKEKAEKEYYRGLAEGRTKTEKPPETPPAQAAPPPEPKPEDFEDWDQFEAARTKWIIATAKLEAIQELETKRAQEVSQTTVQQQVQKVVAAHEERMTKYAEVDPEIKEIAKDPELPFSEPMRAGVMLVEEGPKVIRYLHEHKDEAMRIYDLAPMVQADNGTWIIKPGGNPFRAILEIGRIAGILSTQTEPPPKPKPKSHAPEPHQPVGGTTGGGGPKGDLAELAKTDPAEYLKRVREGKG